MTTSTDREIKELMNSGSQINTELELYEQDYYQWIVETVQQLRQRRFDSVDWDNLIEEVDSLGRSEKKELKRRLQVLLMHLLKKKYQPSRSSRSWDNTIRTQRDELYWLLQDSPSLKRLLPEVLPECYQRAVKSAVEETRLPWETFPEYCPFSVTEILDF